MSEEDDDWMEEDDEEDYGFKYSEDDEEEMENGNDDDFVKIENLYYNAKQCDNIEEALPLYLEVLKMEEGQGKWYVCADLDSSLNTGI